MYIYIYTHYMPMISPKIITKPAQLDPDDPGTPVPEIIDLLADQLTNCVLWDPAMGAMLKDGTLVYLGHLGFLKNIMTIPRGRNL